MYILLYLKCEKNPTTSFVSGHSFHLDSSERAPKRVPLGILLVAPFSERLCASLSKSQSTKLDTRRRSNKTNFLVHTLNHALKQVITASLRNGDLSTNGRIKLSIEPSSCRSREEENQKQSSRTRKQPKESEKFKVSV